MPTSYRLNEAQQKNLAEVCSIGPDALRRTIDRLNSSGLLISRGKIVDILIADLGESLAGHLATFAFGLLVGFRQNNADAEETLVPIDAWIADNASDERFQAWPLCRPELIKLLSSKSIRLATKAQEVSYDFERIYLAGRFLTTIRPLYNDEREDILGAAIVQTLRLEFISSDGENHTLSIALDRGDIQQLRRSCDEALRKADVAYDKLGKWDLPTLMTGDERSEDAEEGSAA